MKALILAAGVGSRLRPLTDRTPKALIPVAGVPILERCLVRLQSAGVRSFVVNAHHHAEAVAAFCADLARRRGVEIQISREDDLLLETGGGLKKAAPLLADGEPFFIHNADVATDVDLGALLQRHRESAALATLSCRRRPSSRQLLFDEADRLRGRRDGQTVEWAGSAAENCASLAFDGISVADSRMLALITESGVFSLTRPWLRLAAAGEPIVAFHADRWSWHDIGTPEKLAAADTWASAPE